MNERVSVALSWSGFSAGCLAILAGPWLFGAWEMWWFWLFAGAIFVSALCFAGRLLADTPRVARPSGGILAGSVIGSPLGRTVLAGLAIFLAYAAVRFLQAEVHMTAERSFLLFLTPSLLGLEIVFGYTRRQVVLLYRLILADLLLLGLYGIVNHAVTRSAMVLWAPGYEQYTLESRATGSYFCPDHFAGIMELALCLSIGILLARGRKWWSRAFGACLAAVALTGVVLSKSRGGGLTVGLTALCALPWGFAQWPRPARTWYRLSAAALVGIAMLVFAQTNRPYIQRFQTYFGLGGRPRGSIRADVSHVCSVLQHTTRGRMIGGAIRAWQSKPVLGIGPGMHQNLWPHFAPSADGDREHRVWPSMPNNGFHSYEVHSDWVQLLEEYGIVGAVLLLVPAAALFLLLRKRFLEGLEGRRRRESYRPATDYHAAALGGMLALVAMGFHSLGDFNLQMPATTWLLAAILTIPVAWAAMDRWDRS